MVYGSYTYISENVLAHKRGFRKPFFIIAMLAVLLKPGISVVSADKSGDEIKRIVSLGPGLTEELYLLGVQDKIVAVTTYCRKPPEAAQKEKAGTAVEVNVEKIISLNPDLVIATGLSNLKSIEKLKNLGVGVEIFPAAESFNGLCRQFLKLAGLVGEEEKAVSILAKVKEKVEEIKKACAGLPKPIVIAQAGAKPLWIAPKKSFINDFIELAGGVNAGPAGADGKYSREKILEINPEIIIITTMGIIGDEEKSLWYKYPGIKAVKNNRIYVIDSDKFCSPTPVTFTDTLKEIFAILHEYKNNKLAN